MDFKAVHIINGIICIAMIIGALDSVRGNKWKLGEKFDAGLAAFPQLIVIMGGMMALVPLLESFLAAHLIQFSSFLGIDPGILPGMILANDMGAFHLSHMLSNDPAAADFGGMLTGGIIGVNLIFTVPVAVSMVSKEDYPYVIRGIVCGFAGAVPGLIIGGVCAGNTIGFVLKQMTVIIIFTALMTLFFVFFTEKAVKIFIFLGKALGWAALAGICVLITLTLCGNTSQIGKFKLLPLQEVLFTVGMVTIALPGAYVAAEVLARILKKPLEVLGRKSGLNTFSMLGMIISLANSLPVFGMTREMNPLGKCVTFAFLTGGAFALGDHLAFCTIAKAELAIPLLATKLSSAVIGAVLAWWIFYKKFHNIPENKQ